MQISSFWRLGLAFALAALFLNPTTAAAQGRGGGGGNGGGGGGGGGEEETGASNVSFPVILSDNVTPSGFPLDGAWRFATIINPATECVGESNVADAVDPSIVCYYGRHVTVVSETGQIVFDGPTKVWWLQKRPANFWKALSVGHDVQTKLVVSAVDLGDLLESTPTIATRQIRTEFNLLQNVPSSDPELGGYVVTDWTQPIPAPCAVPILPGQSLGCFAALAMSGAVPGTEQSGNEAQGTDFGDLVTRRLLDPTTVRAATDMDGNAIPIHSLVYSHCARLVIQRVDGSPNWDRTLGQWAGSGVGSPVANVSAYGGTYSVEINSGGGLVYGFNWNAKTVATGTYRLTFVIDGNDFEGPRCTTTRATTFAPSVTKLVNVGENNVPHIIYEGDSQLGDEGGLVYIDLALTPKGGGKKGGGGRP